MKSLAKRSSYLGTYFCLYYFLRRRCSKSQWLRPPGDLAVVSYESGLPDSREQRWRGNRLKKARETQSTQTWRLPEASAILSGRRAHRAKDSQTLTSACSWNHFSLKLFSLSQEQVVKTLGWETLQEGSFSYLFVGLKTKKQPKMWVFIFPYTVNFPSLLCSLHPLSLLWHLDNLNICPLHRICTN